MEKHGISAVLLTSMHNSAYYSGFLYCSFGRQYGCMASADTCTTITANIDSGHPWRRSCHSDNLIYTDWSQDNFWQAVKHVIGNCRTIAIEGDHMTLVHRNAMQRILEPGSVQDLGDAIM